MSKRVLVTGAAGFIGFHVADRLLRDGAQVLGMDSFTPYYDVALKEKRAALLQSYDFFSLARVDTANSDAFAALWQGFEPEIVIHLAAQAGVRYSIENPGAYVDTNIVGTFNILELARRFPIKHLLAASSSSVYGASTHMPFAETDRTAFPLSLYAATKGAGELMGHAYAHLYGTPMTFFRFFTVYGPWGRPDMAYYKFTKAILEGRPIDVYNHGEMVRDFTYIDDLVESIVRLISVVPDSRPCGPGDSLSPVAPHRVVNLGHAEPTGLLDFIAAIENALGRTTEKRLLSMQAGDVHATHASTDLLRALTGFAPTIPVKVGVPRFVDWYVQYAASEVLP